MSSTSSFDSTFFAFNAGQWGSIWRFCLGRCQQFSLVAALFNRSRRSFGGVILTVPGPLLAASSPVSERITYFGTLTVRKQVASLPKKRLKRLHGFAVRFKNCLVPGLSLQKTVIRCGNERPGTVAGHRRCFRCGNERPGTVAVFRHHFRRSGGS